jgi:DHA1 family purine ribonucleoside efflux pump-like MFS transporter
MDNSSDSKFLEGQKTADWSAVWALTLGVSGLMIGEFLPAGVLTSMATDLKISEGMAGQAVTATSVFAVIASLLIAYLTRKFNRRAVLLWLSSCLVSSSLIVAFAPNFVLLLIGRVLLGIALGGFWSMATAIAIRLVPSENVPKAFSIIFGGASFSAVLAAPLGSFLGNIIGWRNVFLLAATMGVIAFVWQYIALPSLEPIGKVRLTTIFDVLKTPKFILGLIAINLAFCGRFASFTYMRPFLEQVTHLRGSNVSGAFLVFDMAYFVGTLFAARLVSKSLRKGLSLPPLILAASAFGLIFVGHFVVPTLLLLFVLGAAFAPVPVGWSTWTARAAPENTETAGGLYVASVQLSAAVGAMLGGVVFDATGSNGVLALSGASWILSALLVVGLGKKLAKNNSGVAVAISH